MHSWPGGRDFLRTRVQRPPLFWNCLPKKTQWRVEKTPERTGAWKVPFLCGFGHGTAIAAGTSNKAHIF